MATYYFENFPGIGFVDPVIDGVVKTTLNEDSPQTLKIDVVVRFQPLQGMVGNPVVSLLGVQCQDLNYNAGELMERINEHLNQYHT